MPEQLKFQPAIDHPELVSPVISAFLKQWTGSTPVSEILVAEIDPNFSDSAKFCEYYGVAETDGANCVVVEAFRGNESSFAACLIPINSRADLNSKARKHLNARRVSFAPLDKVIEQTNMEYGSITPVGLPPEWPILLDSRIVDVPQIIVGGGLRKSKLLLPGKALTELPNMVVLENLAVFLPTF